MFRSLGAWILSAALVLLGSNAFRQVPGEFRDTEPGSLLFGVLQLVIGTSAVVGAIGVFRRANWAARAIGISGTAAAGLLISLPLFETMPSDARRSIWFGAALVGAVAALMGWCAARLARQAATARASAAGADVPRPSKAQLPEALRSAEPIIPPRSDAHVVPRIASEQRHEDPPQASRKPMQG